MERALLRLTCATTPDCPECDGSGRIHTIPGGKSTIPALCTLSQSATPPGPPSDRTGPALSSGARTGQTQRQIAQACGLSTITVRRWLQTDTLPPERRGYRATGKIDPYVPYLHTRLAAGCTNQSRLWLEIREQGFTGTRSLVGKWIRGQSGRHTTPSTAPAVALPSATQIA
ncbi:MAG: hypothetical protein AAGF95_31985 [Chloroflexota bacterium]